MEILCVRSMMKRFAAGVCAALAGLALAGCSGDATTTVGGTVSTPTVTTATIGEITTTAASGGGTVTADGGATVTERGVCWSTAANPTVSDSHTSDGTGTGAYTSALSGLIQNTTYHVRAFATNSAGTAYGSDVSFTTANPAITRTLTITVSPASSGTVTTNPASGPFADGSTVTLTATPAAGYQFKQWNGANAADVTANQITMNADKALTAEFQAVAGAQWKDYSGYLSGLAGKASLSGMSWVSATEGWIASGAVGEIYHTTDGGKTFTTQTTQFPTYAVYMLTATEGYAGGLNGRVYHTTNSGANWTVIGSIGGTLLSINFPPSSATGYASGYTGRIYSITSSGVSSMSSGVYSNLKSISFPTAAQGWVCGESVIEHYFSGSWHGDQAYPTETYNAVFMIDNSTGWAVGDTGVIIHTTDGLNWSYQTNPDSSHRTLNALFFLNAGEGWAVGDGGVVLHTTNGGATWTIVANALTSNMLTSVRFTSSTNGYILGNNGTLLRFTDQ